MVRVDLLNYNLHRPDGVVGYQEWLALNVVGDAKVINIYYSPDLKVEVVVWDDGI